MVQKGIRSAPVVDADGKLLGEIRLSDILDA
jgi:CBS domain-containing protein